MVASWFHISSAGSCSHLNNCSHHGNCSMFNLCICERRFYGINCSLEKPPLVPPVLETWSSGGTEDTAIPIFLFARIGNVTIEDPILSLTITIYGLPESFALSRGMRSGERVVLRQQDFGNMTLTSAKDFSGSLNLTIRAELKTEYETSFTMSFLSLNVTAQADLPKLITHDACATNVSNTTWSIPLSISSSLNDRDGSESLTVMLSGLPHGYQLNKEQENRTHHHFLKPDFLTGLVASYEGVFEPFILKVVAISVEKSNGDSVNVTRFINVTRCALEFTCHAVKNCSNHGICVAPDQCKCDIGYSGPDCSEESGRIVKFLVMAVIVATVSFFLLLTLVIILVIWRMIQANAKRSQAKVSDSTRIARRHLHYNNPSFALDL